jgi:hypothetical protein
MRASALVPGGCDAANTIEIHQHWIGELDEGYIVRKKALSQVQNRKAARERVCDLRKSEA